MIHKEVHDIGTLVVRCGRVRWHQQQNHYLHINPGAEIHLCLFSVNLSSSRTISVQSAVSVWCTALCTDPGQVVVEDRLRRKQLQIKPFPKTHSELIIIIVSSRNSSDWPRTKYHILISPMQWWMAECCKSKGLYLYCQTEAQHLAAMKYDVMRDLGHEAAKRFHLGLLCLCFDVLCLSSLQVRRSSAMAVWQEQ